MCIVTQRQKKRKETFVTKTYSEKENQDYCTHGKSVDIFGRFTYIVICDGHGTGKLINYIKSQSHLWNKIVNKSSGHKILNALKKRISMFNSYGDGFTISIVKVYKNIIKSYWMGDSRFEVYKNNKKVFRSEKHTNNYDMVELSKRGVPYKKEWNMKVLSPDYITVKKQLHWLFSDKDKLMITRAIGHNNIIKCKFDEKTILYNNDDDITIILATDGFWDMYCKKYDNNLHHKSMNDLINLSVKRWKQTWNYISPTGEMVSKQIEPTDMDDITVAKFTLYAI